MSKKIFASFLSLLIVASLGGCGEASYHEPVTYAAVDDSSQESIAAIESSAAEESSASTESSTDELSAHSGTTATVESSVAKESKPTPEVEWQTLKHTWTDDAGYTFEATIKVSPWINTKNEDYLNAAWDKVGHDKSLPDATAKNWLSWDGYTYYHNNNGIGKFVAVRNVTDFYYCVGSVKIKNVTTGWDITSETKSWDLLISAAAEEDEHNKYFDLVESNTMSRIFYSDQSISYPTWAEIKPIYKSNSWGPLPFVFVHFENKTPNNPEGEYIDDMKNSVFRAYSNGLLGASTGDVLHLDIIEPDN